MKTYIVDTSVILKWYNQKDEKHVKNAKQILHDFKNEQINLIIPDLALVELTNVFLKGKQLPIPEIHLLLANIFGLPLIIKEPSQTDLSKAVSIAELYKITVYDALFVAFAQSESCSLISDDEKAHGIITDGTVLMLSNY